MDHSRIIAHFRIWIASGVLFSTGVGALPATQVVVTQDSAKHTHIQLSGYFPACAVPAPVASSAPTQAPYIEVHQDVDDSGCYNTDYYAREQDLRPYVSIADLGVLADGEYAVLWTVYECCSFPPIFFSQRREWLSVTSGVVVDRGSYRSTTLEPPVVTPSTPYLVDTARWDEGGGVVSSASAGLFYQSPTDYPYFLVHTLVDHANVDSADAALYRATFAGPSLPVGVYPVIYEMEHRYAGVEGLFGGGHPPFFTDLGDDYVIVLDDASKVAAIEFYNAARDHYFLSVDKAEIAALDTGYFAGWTRTGEQFTVYSTTPTVELARAGLAPVCRYYGRPEFGLDTHFFSAFLDECAFVIAAWPQQWILETTNAFQVFRPFVTDGGCQPGTSPVYRMYNNRHDVNHRYTTSLAIRQQMIDKGWVPEGYGPIGVAMCTASAVPVPQH